MQMSVLSLPICLQTDCPHSPSCPGGDPEAAGHSSEHTWLSVPGVCQFSSTKRSQDSLEKRVILVCGSDREEDWRQMFLSQKQKAFGRVGTVMKGYSSAKAKPQHKLRVSLDDRRTQATNSLQR